MVPFSEDVVDFFEPNQQPTSSRLSGHKIPETVTTIPPVVGPLLGRSVIAESNPYIPYVSDNPCANPRALLLTRDRATQFR